MKANAGFTVQVLTPIRRCVSSTEQRQHANLFSKCHHCSMSSRGALLFSLFRQQRMGGTEKRPYYPADKYDLILYILCF